jgi:hypothetical protein
MATKSKAMKHLKESKRLEPTRPLKHKLAP